MDVLIMNNPIVRRLSNGQASAPAPAAAVAATPAASPPPEPPQSGASAPPRRRAGPMARLLRSANKAAAAVIGEDTAPKSGGLRKKISAASAKSFRSNASLRSGLKAPEDGIAAMLHGLRRLPKDVLGNLSSLNRAQLKKEIVQLENKEGRDEEEAQLDAEIKVAEQNAGQHAEPKTVPDAELSQLGLDSLLRDIAANPELRAACVKHQPKPQKILEGASTTIHPEEALLAYHQMRHEQRVSIAKRQLVGAGDTLRKLKAAKTPPQKPCKQQPNTTKTAWKTFWQWEF
jgi:hypothetical protein